MKKILITRKLLRSCEDKAKETFEANFNLNDELYSQKKLIELSAGQDGILSSLTDKLDSDTINKLPDTIKIISNFDICMHRVVIYPFSAIIQQNLIIEWIRHGISHIL